MKLLILLSVIVFSLPGFAKNFNPDDPQMKDSPTSMEGGYSSDCEAAGVEDPCPDNNAYQGPREVDTAATSTTKGRSSTQGRTIKDI